MKQDTANILFAGIDGVGTGLKKAGVKAQYLFEIDPKIAAIGQMNTDGEYVIADICRVQFTKYERSSVLWASPVCKNASVANSNASESWLDRNCAAATASAIRVWLPEIFIMENVWGYRNFDSFEIICQTLRVLGYGFDYWHLNSADYGVPQTRKRLILIARRDGRKPLRPQPTHDRTPLQTLFGCLERWVGWYEAIEDLIPELPDSEFAAWQIERMPENSNRDYLIASGQGNGLGNSDGGSFSFRWAHEPALTQQCGTGHKNTQKALVGPGIVVDAGVPRVLARFQSFPDDFKLSGHRKTDCTGIGNAVPPLLAFAAYQSTRLAA